MITERPHALKVVETAHFGAEHVDDNIARWIEWIREQDSAVVPAKGKRMPGGRGDPVIEDAPGRYVKAR